LICGVELAELLPYLAPVVVTAVDSTGPVVVVHARTHLDKASACIGCGSGYRSVSPGTGWSAATIPRPPLVLARVEVFPV